MNPQISTDGGLSYKELLVMPENVLSEKYRINEMQYYMRRGNRIYLRNAHGYKLSFDVNEVETFKGFKYGTWLQMKMVLDNEPVSFTQPLTGTGLLDD